MTTLNPNSWTQSLAPQEIAAIELALLDQQGKGKIDDTALSYLLAKLAFSSDVSVTLTPPDGSVH